MGMPHPTERWTAERVRALPDDGRRYELVHGELLVTPAPGRLHQAMHAALFSALFRYLAATGAGSVYSSPADPGFGDDILQPDLFVFRGAGGSGNAWPDADELLLVAEVLSPSTAAADRGIKRLRYQRAGVPEYWIVDLDARVFERWRPNDTRPERLRERLTWTPVADAQPLHLHLPELFASVLA